jgi:PAS domain S-box-containing protein
MDEHEHSLASNNSSRYSGKLWSSSPIAQEPVILLAELASEISTVTDFEALQRILARKLRWILDFERCTLAVRAESLDTEYLLFEITSPSKAKNIPSQKLPIEQGWSGKVLIDSKPYFIEDLAQLLPSIISPPNEHLGIAPKARSLMLLPLQIGERIIGSLNFSSNTVGAYSTAWRNLASLLAAQISGQLGSILAQVQLKSAYEFRERVMESTTDAIFTLDLQGNFTLVNQRTAEITGYSVEELLGFSFLRFFDLEQSPTIQTLLLTIISNGVSISQYDAEIVSKDGSKKIITFNLSPLFIEGKISAIASTAQDITERKQAESALLRAKVAEAANLALESQVQERTLQLQQALDFEARLKRITDKVRDSLDESQIVQAGVQELALGLNVGCCNMAFYNLEQGTSTICYEYAVSIPASQGRVAQIADFPELYHQLLQNQYFQFCSIVPHPKRGQVAMLACPISDDQGIIGDLWLINQKNHVFNESEIRLVQQVANQCAIAIRQARLYQAATAQVKELEKLNLLKDDFLSTVSHELRTPLANINMAIHMLKIAPTASARERYLEILQNECTREIELINDLLDLQRLEAASYSNSHEVVNLQDWLPSIIEPIQVRIQERQQRLRVELPSFLPPIISDATTLGRILSELLNNACKYTPEEGEIVLSVCYKLGSSRQSEEQFGQGVAVAISFTISNQAEIPQTELPHIFEKFYRVPGADRWKQGGTGLGLALVQNLVTTLQGTIQVESSEGWTSFIVQATATVVEETP